MIVLTVLKKPIATVHWIKKGGNKRLVKRSVNGLPERSVLQNSDHSGDHPRPVGQCNKLRILHGGEKI